MTTKNTIGCANRILFAMLCIMSLYQGKTVVVTGSHGFVGSHLVDALLSAGAFVIGIDNMLTGSKQNLSHQDSNPKFHAVYADVCTEPATFLSIPDGFPSKIFALFHLASPASPVGYQKHPIETYMVNSFALHSILTFLQRHHPACKLIFTSTSEVYGDPLKHPQQETYWGNVDPNGPRSMYDESKRLGETICGVFHKLYDMDTRIVRLFNVYGPRLDLSDGRVIPDFVKSVRERKPFHIHGDGNQTRSFCYVDDTIQGILSVGEKDGLSGETINIGNPEEVTINELVEVFCRVSGRKKSLSFSPARPGDPHRRCPDITKAKKCISWQPSISLHQGIQKTLEFYRIIT